MKLGFLYLPIIHNIYKSDNITASGVLVNKRRWCRATTIYKSVMYVLQMHLNPSLYLEVLSLRLKRRVQM